MYFSTREIARLERHAAWQEAIGGHCGTFVTESPSVDFEASMEQRGGPLRCSRIMQSRGRAYRTRREIDNKPIQTLLVILQIAGSGVMEQCGNAANLEVGNLTLIDLLQPSSFHFDDRSVQLSLHLPRESILMPGNKLPQLGTKLPARAQTLIAPLVRAAFEQSGQSSHYLDAVHDAVVSLIMAAQVEHCEQPGSRRQREVSGTLKVIQDYVLNHLGSDLTPAEIAQANNVSERSLHRLFKTYGLGLCEWIRQNRLDRCASDLRDPQMQRASITEIAFNWGFNNSAHFSRVFRDQFNRTPREYRSSAQVVVRH